MSRRPTRGRRAPEPGEAPVAQVMNVMLVALLLGSLLLGHQIERAARHMEFGPARTAAVLAAWPGARINHLFFLDRMWTATRRWADGWMDLGVVDLGDTVSAEPTAPPPAVWVRPRVPTTSTPLALYLCGDSVGRDVGQSVVAMAAETERIGTDGYFRVSSGIARPDFFDWPAYLTKEMAGGSHEAVWAMFGANDGQGVEVDGDVLNFGTPEWKAMYAGRVGRTMDILGGGGTRRVYWVGQPIARKAEYSSRVRVLDDIYAAEAGKRANVVYIDSWTLFQDAGGRYADYLPDASGRSVKVRKDDGVHLTRAGCDRLARHILEEIERDWWAPAEGSGEATAAP